MTNGRGAAAQRAEDDMERHESWKWIIDWTSRMARIHGANVVDREAGVTWDWGQALVRQVYGKDWMHSDQFYEETDTELDEPAPDKLLDAAEIWEKNGNPHWATTKK